MNNRQNILQELEELKSMLASAVPANCYSVPAGYFQGLAGQVLSRIKALEVTSATDELNILSASLAGLSKKTVYNVPRGYFEELPGKMLAAVQKPAINKTAKEELESISPLLSGLKKEMPYRVPQGYFESSIDTPAQPETKVISISSRKWFRYAAAAVVAGIIILAGFLYNGNTSGNQAQSLATFEKKLTKEIDKTSDKELDDFLQQFSDAGLTGEEKASAEADKEVKELLKDVSETELKEFLQETSEGDISSGTEEPSIMN